MSSILKFKIFKICDPCQNLYFPELQKLSRNIFRHNFCKVWCSGNIIKIWEIKDKIKCNKTQYNFNKFFLDLMGLKLLRKISTENFGKFQPKKKKKNNFWKNFKIKNCNSCYLIRSIFIFKWRQTPFYSSRRTKWGVNH